MIPRPTPTLFLFLQSGGGSVPPMKVVTPGASRLKAVQGQSGSPDKGKHGKQRAEYMRIQAQQQVGVAPWGGRGSAPPGLSPYPSLPRVLGLCGLCGPCAGPLLWALLWPPPCQPPRDLLPARTALLVP